MNGPAPLVSVAMAAYNGARYLRPQLDSIYAQTVRDFEVVVSDDGSTDGTRAVLEEYRDRHGLRFEVQERRRGLVGNFESALRMCRGEWIALADQDDLWKPDKLEVLLHAGRECSLAYGEVSEVLTADGGSRVDPTLLPAGRFARVHGSGRPTRHLIAENWVVSHSVLLHREVLDHALPIPPGQPFHDGWLALVASKLRGIRFVDRRLQVYRSHDESLTWKRPETVPAGFFDRWRALCAFEVARLDDVLALPLLSEAEKRFARRVRAMYLPGLGRGGRLAAFVAALRVTPYVSTLHRRPLGRLKTAVRAALGAPAP